MSMTLSWAALLMTMPIALLTIPVTIVSDSLCLNQTMALGDSASFTTSQRRFVHCSAIQACPLELGDGTNRRDLRGLRSCAKLCPWRFLLRPRTLLVGLEIESTESILIPGLVVLLASGLEICITIEQRWRRRCWWRWFSALPQRRRWQPRRWCLHF